MRFLLAGPLFAGKSFLLKKTSLQGQPQFAVDDFQTVRSRRQFWRGGFGFLFSWPRPFLLGPGWAAGPAFLLVVAPFAGRALFCGRAFFVGASFFADLHF